MRKLNDGGSCGKKQSGKGAESEDPKRMGNMKKAYPFLGFTPNLIILSGETSLAGYVSWALDENGVWCLLCFKEHTI